MVYYDHGILFFMGTNGILHRIIFDWDMVLSIIVSHNIFGIKPY